MLLDEPERVRLALSPIRRQLLERLRAPASATQLASELSMGRQRLNYHLRALEEAGLLALVEERQRRGCVERILVARADAFIVDPGVMAADREDSTAAARAAQDTFAAGYLIDTAADVVRHVARMQTQAARQGTRLVTFTIDTELSFATPADLERFTAALAEFVAKEAAKEAAKIAAAHGTTTARPYRIVIGGLPAPRKSAEKPASPTGETRHDRPRSRAHRDPHRRPH
jgi:DNA-binding transcriptional ArsR family regulator